MGDVLELDDLPGPTLRLALAVSRIKARSREEAGGPRPRLSMTQWAILVRLAGSGPATASELAASEHVSQQAMAQSVGPLKSAGLLTVQPDPRDRRKHGLDVTSEGRALLRAVAEDSWLTRAIETAVGPGERDTLDRAIDLLERIAAANRDRSSRPQRRSA